MLIVEDGTGLANANGYITVAYLDDYAANIGYDISLLTTAQKESTIIRVSMNYIDITYDFAGNPLSADQALSLPTDEVAINEKIKRGVADACIVDAKGELFKTVDPNGSVKRIKEKLDVMENEVEYQDTTNTPSQYGKTPVTDKLMSGYLSSAGSAGFARWAI